jgi:ABC-type glutathione transport system ATPase component
VPPLLQVDDLTVRYGSSDQGQLVALEGVTCDIGEGEAVGVLGESGCGKTTLGLTLLGLLPPAGKITRGSAVFGGRNLLMLRERELRGVRGAGISMVHQEPGAALNPVLRVGEQVAEVLRAHRHLSREGARDEARSLLALVGLAKETSIEAAYPHQLSGGQQQRVAIAQAIACRPRLVIADEPTTALDTVTQLEILNLLRNLREKLQVALLFITHDPEVLMRAVDRILVMREGRIVEQGSTWEVTQKSQHAYTQELLNSSLHRKDHQQSVAPTRKGIDSANFCAPVHPIKTYHPRRERSTEANGKGSGREGGAPPDSAPVHTDSQPAERETLLHVVNLHKSYVQGRWLSRRQHQIDALRGTGLELLVGSTLALIGASGSGKSTLARCLACLERPDSGEIRFGGRDLAKLSRGELIPFCRQIQLIFQDPGSSLNPRFTAVEIISEPLLTVHPRTKKDSAARALAMMELVGLQADWGQRLPHQFSAGQRRRLAIARALALEPRLLILDEALAGLDLPIQAQIIDLLVELQARLSLTYLYISHDLRLVARLADEVAVLHQGKIVESAPTPELLAKPQSEQAVNLVSATLELSRFPS